MNLFAKIKEKANRISERFTTPKTELTEICKQVYHLPYPTNPQLFAAITRELSAQQLQVWNLSEYPYPPAIT
jgi:hypothetical protein